MSGGVPAEYVTATADGLEQLGFRWARLDLVAQTTDLHVDTSIEGSLGASVGEVQELVAAEDPLRVLDERNQKIVLACTEVDDQPLGRLEPPQTQVQFPAGEAEELPT